MKEDEENSLIAMSAPVVACLPLALEPNEENKEGGKEVVERDYFIYNNHSNLIYAISRSHSSLYSFFLWHSCSHTFLTNF